MVVTEYDGGMRVEANGHLAATDVRTMPYPGFPTDLQAQMMALMTRADGTSTFTETVFENRMLHAVELTRMGARHPGGREHRARARPDGCSPVRR